MWNFKTNRLQRGTLLTALILAVFCLIVALALHFAEASRPTVVVYPAGYRMPANQGPLLERFIPRQWDWAWKLRDKIRGKAKEVFIEGSSFAVKDTADSLVSKLELGPPTLDAEGAKVWVVQKTGSATLQKQLRHLSEATELFTGRITTRENGRADLSMGDSIPTASGLVHVGITLQTFPRVRGNTIDLMTVFTSTEVVTNVADVSIRTNAVIATRIQVPPTGSVLILASGHSSETNGHIALVLSAKRN
jgi:hypothetical protein